jgi:diguanylate cyclase (GGDEF)-like protein
MSHRPAVALSRVGIFSLLTEEEIALLSEHLSTVTLREGETLFHEGDEGHDLYILVRGLAAVSIRLPDGGSRVIARFQAGDFFGDMSIFDNAPRSATCTALEASELSSLSREAFSDVIEQHPGIALKLMYRMLNITTQRLRGTSEFVSEMVLWGEGARKRAVTDELTGVYNRRFLEDSLGTYVAEAREKGEPLSFVMSDLDHFREINESYGHAKGDEMIKAAAGVFRAVLGEGAVVARYGGDEFVIVFPRTDSARATDLMEAARTGVEKLETLKGLKGTITTVTSSMGVASFPEHAADLAGLRAAADEALYRAKEEGRNRVVCARPPERVEPVVTKKPLRSIREKNQIIERVIEAFTTRRRFLVLGHQSPDDDCISSMVSTALLLHMFYRDAAIYLGGAMHERFRYLFEICRYNSINVVGPADPLPPDLDTLVLCDTPKPSMIDASPAVRELIRSPRVLRMEIDHHLGADSEYFGDEGYRLVSEASSASELIGHILLKLEGRKALLERHQVTELYPRNLVLAILTGIIGDSNMGQYLKSRREKRYYAVFSGMFNEMLARRTTKKTNFFTMNDVYTELQKVSVDEEGCFRFMMDRRRVEGSIGFVALGEGDMSSLFAGCGEEAIVSAARVLADRLAEESGKLGLVVYYDNPERSDLVQFRLRRAGAWKSYDLRNLLGVLAISNGGGHEGAIGFRVPRGEIGDFPRYVDELRAKIEAAIGARAG